MSSAFALPQVHASEEELAHMDEMRYTQGQEQLEATQQMQQHSYRQTDEQEYARQQEAQREMSQSVRLPPPVHQHALQQQASRTFGGLDRSQRDYRLPSSQQVYQYRHVQRPQTGIAAVPKHAQPQWQSLLREGPYQYEGDTFRSALSAHMPSSRRAAGHADGPQHLGPDAALNGALPDAPHRQAWASQPTFRFFKRSHYEGVSDRWAKQEGMLGRGDSTYRPLSCAEQAAINSRVDRHVLLRGVPRKGQW